MCSLAVGKKGAPTARPRRAHLTPTPQRSPAAELAVDIAVFSEICPLSGTAEISLNGTSAESLGCAHLGGNFL